MVVGGGVNKVWLLAERCIDKVWLLVVVSLVVVVVVVDKIEHKQDNARGVLDSTNAPKEHGTVPHPHLG